MTSNNQAHSDHKQWRNEVAMWRDDIHQWRKEHGGALLALSCVIGSYDGSLDEYQKSIDQHELNVIRAEHAIVVSKRSATRVDGGQDRILDESHRLDFDKQSQLRESHARIKQHHYGTMAKVSRLLDAYGNSIPATEPGETPNRLPKVQLSTITNEQER